MVRWLEVGERKRGLGFLTFLPHPPAQSTTAYQTLGLPGKPTHVGVLGYGSGAVKLKWEAPGVDGNAAIKMYKITLTAVSGDMTKRDRNKPIVVECTADGPDPQCDGEYIVSNLKNGIQYSVVISAKNRFGWGPSSIDPVLVLSEPNPGEAAAKRTGPLAWNKNKSGRRLAEQLE